MTGTPTCSPRLVNDDKIAWYENDGSQVFTQRIISTAADGATVGVCGGRGRGRRHRCALRVAV